MSEVKKTKTKPKAKPFTHKGVTIEWSGVRVATATYKGCELMIKSGGLYSRSLYIDGRKAHSGETLDDLKEYVVEYLGG